MPITSIGILVALTSGSVSLSSLELLHSSSPSTQISFISHIFSLHSCSLGGFVVLLGFSSSTSMQFPLASVSPKHSMDWFGVVSGAVAVSTVVADVVAFDVDVALAVVVILPLVVVIVVVVVVV